MTSGPFSGTIFFRAPHQHVMSILRALESHSFASNPLLSGKALLTVVA